MAKISLKEIKEKLVSSNWKVISTDYVNLDTEMHFQCAEGHDIYTSWKKLRNKIECPICKKNTLTAPELKIEPKSKGVFRILALDQASYNTGFAIFDNTKLVSTGIFETNKSEEIERISIIRNWLISMIINWKPDLIGIEGIQFQNTSGARVMGVTVFETLAHLQGVVMLTAHEQNIPFQVCPTNTWRHECGVKGTSRADRKRSMQLLVKKWYDVTVSDDIADAIGIGYYLSNKTTKSLIIENWEK